MKAKLMLIAGCMILSSVLLTACGEEQNPSYPSSVPETTQKTTYPVLNDPNAEFADAPETAPIIIEPDYVPEAEPQTEVYNAAPETMPENQE